MNYHAVGYERCANGVTIEQTFSAIKIIQLNTHFLEENATLYTIKVAVFKLVQYLYHLQILQQNDKHKTPKIKMPTYINHTKKNIF
jgi:hypothetical protein